MIFWFVGTLQIIYDSSQLQAVTSVYCLRISRLRACFRTRTARKTQFVGNEFEYRRNVDTCANERQNDEVKKKPAKDLYSSWTLYCYLHTEFYAKRFSSRNGFCVPMPKLVCMCRKCVHSVSDKRRFVHQARRFFELVLCHKNASALQFINWYLLHVCSAKWHSFRACDVLWIAQHGMDVSDDAFYVSEMVFCLRQCNGHNAVDRSVKYPLKMKSNKITECSTTLAS